MKCRCAKVKKELVLHGRNAELPPHLREALETCPECRTFWAQTRRVAALMALKRHERPDEQALQHCRMAVHRKLTELGERSARETWEPVWESPFPAFRFGLAALLMALLGLHIFSASHLPPIRTSEQALVQQALDADAEPQEQLAQEESLNPEFPVMMISNWAPRVEQSGAYQFIGLGP